MKLIFKGKDYSHLLTRLCWSGDVEQAARKLEFAVAVTQKKPPFSELNPQLGEVVMLYSNNGELLFQGSVVSRDVNSRDKTFDFVAFDDLFALTRSKVHKLINDAKAEMVAADICKLFGVPAGTFVPTGKNIKLSTSDRPGLGYTAYEVIMAAYYKASLKTGKKYFATMNQGKLSVLEKGTLLKGVTLSAETNIESTSYRESTESAVSRVMIVDDKGRLKGQVVDNATAKQLKIQVQDVYFSEKGKTNTEEAKKRLVATEQSATLTGLSDLRCIAGYAVMVQDPVTQLTGKFYIEGDSHTWEKGVPKMTLTLKFKNEMAEKEV